MMCLTLLLALNIKIFYYISDNHYNNFKKFLREILFYLIQKKKLIDFYNFKR